MCSEFRYNCNPSQALELRTRKTRYKLAFYIKLSLDKGIFSLASYYHNTALLQKSIWEKNQGAKTPATATEVGVGSGWLELEEGVDGFSFCVATPTGGGKSALEIPNRQSRSRA